MLVCDVKINLFQNDLQSLNVCFIRFSTSFGLQLICSIATSWERAGHMGLVPHFLIRFALRNILVASNT